MTLLIMYFSTFCSNFLSSYLQIFYIELILKQYSWFRASFPLNVKKKTYILVLNLTYRKQTVREIKWYDIPLFNAVNRKCMCLM